MSTSPRKAVSLDRDLIIGMARDGFLFAPTTPGLSRSDWTGWPDIATGDESTITSWLDAGYSLVSVAKRGHGFMVDIDDLQACRSKGFAFHNDPDTFSVTTPSGGLHIYGLHDDATETLGNLIVVHERKGDRSSKKILEVKLHNQSVAAPSAVRFGMAGKKDGVYSPRAPYSDDPGYGLSPAVLDWLKEHAEPWKSNEPSHSDFVGFDPSFDLAEFLDHHGCTEHQSGVVGDSFHISVEECPLCGKPARRSTLAADVSKFIFSGSSFGFVCHACGVSSRAELEATLCESDPNFEPWQDCIYRGDDPDSAEDVERLGLVIVEEAEPKIQPQRGNEDLAIPEQQESEPAAVIDAEDPLEFPEDAMYGKLGEMARTMQVPLGLAYPALIGSYSAHPVQDEMDGTRINAYVILLAGVGGGKRVATERALKMLGSNPGVDYFEVDTVSDRGIGSILGDKPPKRKGERARPGPRKALLVFDEFEAVLKKSRIENSGLFQTLQTLFDSNRKVFADKAGCQTVNCRLSFIGGLPVSGKNPEKFAEFFGRESSHGMLDRIILGYSGVKFNYRRWEWNSIGAIDRRAPSRRETVIDMRAVRAELLGYDEYDSPTTGDELLDVLRIDANKQAPERFTSALSEEELAAAEIDPWQHSPSVCGVTPEAQALYESWDHPTDQSGRAKYYLMKIALLAAHANGESKVTREGMEAAMKFMEWQMKLRGVFKPGVAENVVSARAAERILDTLQRVEVEPALRRKYVTADGYVKWRRVSHDHKWAKTFGPDVVYRVMESLINCGELEPMPGEDDGKPDKRYVRLVGRGGEKSGDGEIPSTKKAA